MINWLLFQPYIQGFLNELSRERSGVSETEHPASVIQDYQFGMQQSRGFLITHALTPQKKSATMRFCLVGLQKGIWEQNVPSLPRKTEWKNRG